jgi:FKBP-type peptidyl-prolyl cis-trans isomerase
MSIFEENRQRKRPSLPAVLTVLDDFRSDPSNRPTHASGPWRSESTARTFLVMRNLVISILLSSSVAFVSCQGDDESTEKPIAAPRKVKPQGVPQVAPPIDLQTPPADATKTASGLVYKRLVANKAGAQARTEQTVLVRYTGWRQRTGQTFFTNGGSGQPIAIDLAHAAPGFREALLLLHKGEKAVLWMPAGAEMPEPVAYEVELVDILPKPVAVDPERVDRSASQAAALRNSMASPSTAASRRSGPPSSAQVSSTTVAQR